MSTLFTFPRQFLVSSGGTPYAGMRLYVYEAGTTNDKTVYQDSELTTPHAQPIEANASGILPEIYLDAVSDTNYRFTAKTAADVLIYDMDDVPAASVTSEQIGTALFPRSAAEIAEDVEPIDYTYPPGDLWRLNPVGDGLADDTAQLIDMYAACKNSAGRNRMLIRDGIYKITEQLLWDGPVMVEGRSRENCIIKAAGNFAAIKINDNGQESTYREFSVDRLSGTGRGIDIFLGGRITLERLIVNNHSSDGIAIRAGNLGTYKDIKVRSNGGSGISVESGTGDDPGNSAWACTFINIDALGNSTYGMDFAIGNSHFGYGLVCQANTLGGIRVRTNTNRLDVYAESNTGTDVYLDSNSIRNLVFINNADSNADILDDGTNNLVIDVARYAMMSAPIIGMLPRATNVAGRSVVFIGGHAGAGDTGRAGGSATLTGGDAAGSSGAAAGGSVYVYGASGVNGGDQGKVYIGGTAAANAISKYLSGTATYDPGNLADGAGATTTVTVTGAALGDIASASFSLDLQGITLTAWVSAADTVSVRFQNESGGTLDLASGTVRAGVWKH